MHYGTYMKSTANILLANVAGNARHMPMHCVYFAYTLPVVQELLSYSKYYPSYQRVLPTTCMYGTGNL